MHLQRNTVINVLILLAGIAALIFIGWYYLYLHSSSVSTASSTTQPLANDQLLVVLPTNGGSEQYLYDPATSKISPVVVPGYESDIVTDSLRFGSTGFYILQSKDSDMSQIVMAKIGTKGAVTSVTPLTTSATSKFDMSYDPLTQTLVYDAAISPKTASITDIKITTLNVTTKSEKVIGVGVHPVILRGGETVFASIGVSLEAIPTKEFSSSSSPKIVLTTGTNGPVAVSADSKMLAMYQAKTNTVQLYTIVSPMNLSYVESETVPFAPSVMTFDGEKVLLGGVASSAGNPLTFGYAGSTSITKTVDYPSAQKNIVNQIQKLTLIHD